MKNSIFVDEIWLGDIVVTKFHIVGDLNFLGVLRNNQVASKVFMGNSYVSPILPVEIPGMAGASFIVNDNLKSEGSKGFMVVATWTITIFSIHE